nr:vegetative cell wall protein gp1-like [Lolium perenne]
MGVMTNNMTTSSTTWSRYLIVSHMLMPKTKVIKINLGVISEIILARTNMEEEIRNMLKMKFIPIRSTSTKTTAARTSAAPGRNRTGPSVRPPAKPCSAPPPALASSARPIAAWPSPPWPCTTACTLNSPRRAAHHQLPPARSRPHQRPHAWLPSFRPLATPSRAARTLPPARCQPPASAQPPWPTAAGQAPRCSSSTWPARHRPKPPALVLPRPRATRPRCSSASRRPLQSLHARDAAKAIHHAQLRPNLPARPAHLAQAARHVRKPRRTAPGRQQAAARRSPQARPAPAAIHLTQRSIPPSYSIQALQYTLAQGQLLQSLKHYSSKP